MPMIGFLKKFRPEFEAYLEGKRTAKHFITAEELVGAH